MYVLSKAYALFVLVTSGLDRTLICLSRLFGVQARSATKRYVVFLALYGAIYAVGGLPLRYVPLVALATGYLGVLAAGRAWVANEKARALIAKKLRDGNPDAMPDLRAMALVSALQLLVLFPLIFMQAHRHFGLYAVPGETTFWDWVMFTADSYNKAFLGLFEVYGVHVRHIDYQSTWGRHLVTLSRATFDFLLIQAVARIVAIRAATEEAVMAVRRDTEMAVRMGRRAVGPLIARLGGKDFRVLANAARALGEIGDRQAVEPLHDLMRLSQSEWSRRWTPAPESEAESRLPDGDTASPFREDVRIVDEPEASAVIVEAAIALAALGDPRSLDVLYDAYKGRNRPPLWLGDNRLRRRAALAAGRLGDRRAVKYLIKLLSRLSDAEAAAACLGAIRDQAAIPPLIEALRAWAGQPRERAAAALQAFGPAAVPGLCQALSTANCSGFGDAESIIQVLGLLGDARAVAPLLAVLPKADNYCTLYHVVEALLRLGYPGIGEVVSIIQRHPAPPELQPRGGYGKEHILELVARGSPVAGPAAVRQGA